MDGMNFGSDPLMGLKVRDVVTGFEGVVVGFAIHLTGCKQYVVKPKVKEDGTASEGFMIDEGRVKVVGRGIRPEEVPEEKPGSAGAMELPSDFPKAL